MAACDLAAEHEFASGVAPFGNEIQSDPDGLLSALPPPVLLAAACSPVPVTARTVPTTAPAAVAAACVTVSTTLLAVSRIVLMVDLARAGAFFAFLTSFVALEAAVRVIFLVLL